MSLLNVMLYPGVENELELVDGRCGAISAGDGARSAPYDLLAEAALATRIVTRRMF
jgi:hypothetical protein